MSFRKPRKGFAGARWTPKIAPDNPDELPKYLFDELQSLSDHLSQSNRLHLERTTPNQDERASSAGPEKPDDGDIIYADDGVVGEPSGLYYYNGEGWVLIA